MSCTCLGLREMYVLPGTGTGTYVDYTVNLF